MRKSKSWINKSILDKGWHKLDEFIKYKAYRSGKAVFNVSANYTSQECADCSYIHPDHRKSQELFIYENYRYTDNADKNVAEVIKNEQSNSYEILERSYRSKFR